MTHHLDNGSYTLNQPSVSYMDLADLFYTSIAFEYFPQLGTGNVSAYLPSTDAYLIQTLGLLPSDPNKKPKDIALHDVENALSVVAASVFWTLGHVPPPLSYDVHVKGSTIAKVELPGPQEGAPVLLQGNATILAMIPQARLNLSIISVAAGLSASLILLLVSLRFLHFCDGETREDVGVDGMGILQAMWLYRHHPELERIFEHVDEPTNDNLRQAALIQTRLADEPDRRQQTKSASLRW
ncbi:hypothetical protein K438DRAFT_1970921 [Mycena galopus ATCC 62051]|nr:hypothetical protein K438DRAFT_1970921 [Mycena galopus ATCC 62051]